jgi:excisionase family DNA binding protein
MFLNKNYSSKDHLLSRKQAANYLGVTENTLSVWASVKRYNLPYVKVGRLVRYRLSDLDAFLTRRTVMQTETTGGK